MQKSINVSKYNANGNDFIIFHTLLEQNYSSLAISLCDRINGVGADGLVVVLPSQEADFKWDFYKEAEATIFVPNTLFFIASSGFCSISGTCLYAAA